MGVPMIIYQLSRIRKCRYLDEIIVATSTDESDDELSSILEKENYKVFRGKLNDVLGRFSQCIKREQTNAIVRLTGDCPLTDPLLVDEIVYAFHQGQWDYLANTIDENNLTVPDGFDVEVFTKELLDRATTESKLAHEREHVTLWFKTPNANAKWAHFCHERKRRYYRVTVDRLVDYTVVSRIVRAIHSNKSDYGVDDVVDFLDKNPRIAEMNLSIPRNEGLQLNLQK